MKDKDCKKLYPVKCLEDNTMLSVARIVKHRTDCLARLCSLQSLSKDRWDNQPSEMRGAILPVLRQKGALDEVFQQYSTIRICRTGIQPQSCYFHYPTAGSARISMLYKILPDCLHHLSAMASMWLLISSPPSHTVVWHCGNRTEY